MIEVRRLSHAALHLRSAECVYRHASRTIMSLSCLTSLLCLSMT